MNITIYRIKKHAQRISQSTIKRSRLLYQKKIFLTHSKDLPEKILLPFIALVRVQDGFTLHRFSLRNPELNPFSKACLQFQQNHNSSEKAHKILHRYYSSVQPKNVSEWIDVDKVDCQKIANIPPLYWKSTTEHGLDPWSDKPLTKDDNLYSDIFRYMPKNFPRIHQQGLFGPVSNDRIHLETQRIINLTQSISSNGYRRKNSNDGDINVTILIRDDGQVRWLAMAGVHRSAVLTAMGYKIIPVRVVQIIFEYSIRTWPKVINGYFSEKGAKSYFDHYFHSEYPSIAKEWLNESTF
ncbi:MAG: hypothetical protein MI684_01815 [Chlorobiales bacterium]|nr:hypothetical protein [Chlorobiales bacterium]